MVGDWGVGGTLQSERQPRGGVRARTTVGLGCGRSWGAQALPGPSGGCMEAGAACRWTGPLEGTSCRCKWLVTFLVGLREVSGVGG